MATKKKASSKEIEVEVLDTVPDTSLTTKDTVINAGTALAVLGTNTVQEIVQSVKGAEIMKPADTAFLMENSQHLGSVMEKTFMWRTDFQKRSIVNDINHPTNHSKFHQAILEQKVQFDQALYLAKEFEEKKFEVEELECDLEEVDDLDISEKRKDIKRRKIQLDLQFAQYQLNNMKIAMEYRMAEVRGWQVIEEDLIAKMRDEGYSDEQIWQRDYDEIEELFFKSMNNLQGIKKSTDGGEYNNLIIVATYAYKAARSANCLKDFRTRHTWTIAVQDSVNFIEATLKERGEL